MLNQIKTLFNSKLNALKNIFLQEPGCLFEQDESEEQPEGPCDDPEYWDQEDGGNLSCLHDAPEYWGKDVRRHLSCIRFHEDPEYWRKKDRRSLPCMKIDEDRKNLNIDQDCEESPDSMNPIDNNPRDVENECEKNLEYTCLPSDEDSDSEGIFENIKRFQQDSKGNKSQSPEDPYRKQEIEEFLENISRLREDLECVEKENTRLLKNTKRHRETPKFVDDGCDEKLDDVQRAREDSEHKIIEIGKVLRNTGDPREGTTPGNERCLQKMKLLCRNLKFGDQETDKSIEYIRQFLANPERRAKEIERSEQKPCDLREDGKYWEQEDKSFLQKMERLWQDSPLREDEYEKNPDDMKQLCENPSKSSGAREIERTLHLCENLKQAEEENERCLQNMKQISAGSDRIDHMRRLLENPEPRAKEIERTEPKPGDLPEDGKYVEQEDESFLQKMERLRRDSKLREDEYEKNPDHMKQLREDPSKSSSAREIERTLESAGHVRENLRHAEEENESCLKNMKRLRQEIKLEKDNEKKHEFIRTCPGSFGHRSIEIERTLKSVGRLREHIGFAQRENERCLQKMKRLHQEMKRAAHGKEAVYKGKEIEKTLESTGHLREDLKFAEEENERCLLRVRRLRQVTRFGEKEDKNNVNSIRCSREDAEYREREVQRVLESVNSLRDYIQYADEENERCLENIRRLQQALKITEETEERILEDVRYDDRDDLEDRRKEVERILEIRSRLCDELLLSNDDNRSYRLNVGSRREDTKSSKEGIEKNLECVTRPHEDTEEEKKEIESILENRSRLCEELLHLDHESERYVEDKSRYLNVPCSHDGCEKNHIMAPNNLGRKRNEIEKTLENKSLVSDDRMHLEQKNLSSIENLRRLLQEPKFPRDEAEGNSEYIRRLREDPEHRRKEFEETLENRSRQLCSGKENERLIENPRQRREDPKRKDEEDERNNECIKYSQGDTDQQGRDFERALVNMNRLCSDLLNSENDNGRFLQNLRHHGPDPNLAEGVGRNQEIVWRPYIHEELRGTEIEGCNHGRCPFHDEPDYAEHYDDECCGHAGHHKHLRFADEVDECTHDDEWLATENPDNRRSDMDINHDDVSCLNELENAEQGNRLCLENMRRLREVLSLENEEDITMESISHPCNHLDYLDEDEERCLEKIDLFVRIRRMHEKRK